MLIFAFESDSSHIFDSQTHLHQHVRINKLITSSYEWIMQAPEKTFFFNICMGQYVVFAAQQMFTVLDLYDKHIGPYAQKS